MSLIKTVPEERQLELGDRTRLIEVEHEGRRYVIAGGARRSSATANGATRKSTDGICCAAM